MPPIFRLFTTRLAPVLLAWAVLLGAAPAQAQLSIIRDAEIEAMVADFAEPLLRAAGMPRTPRIVIVNERRFNAFVTEEGDIYVNYGTILESPNPAALKAVLAHEIGHLAGGHVARLREQMELRARVQAVTMFMGIGAIAAASGSGASSDVSQMASAMIMASQSASINSLMAYRQGEESAADAAALRILEAAGQTPRGLVDTLTILMQNQVQRAGASGYLSTHPLAQDRLQQVELTARQSPYWSRGDSSADIQALDMAKAKLAGFLEGTATVANRYPNSNGSLAARYARVIAAYKAGGGVSALQIMPSLISAAPSNAYLRELYGQMLYELGRPAEALVPLRRAVELAPDATLIRILYGQALVGAGGTSNLNEAILQLKRSAVAEPRNVRIHLLLSQAYGGLGMAGHASLAAAEAALWRGEASTARGLARQAQGQLPQGSPEWLRAGDILAMN
ncbi:M48 family metalloprotease [Pelagibacterium xiamenense]|uniref:M48 family metalloprotease n=1 Tax=Pelagibacterium xiamenense TaxID=2901140 RepID=UPI001E2DC984|nr:M48 family metalloprotease [Pelagibacterium xiamenense]MCD7061112.1 M48 family metalloprotease [Pelagibacterium xiamenense]